MKFLVALAVAAAAFAYLLVEPYAAARVVVERQETVRARMPRLEPGRADGYRFAWVRGGGLPDLFVARPEASDAAMPMWFATGDGEHLFAFDTIRYRTPPDGPDLLPLRRYLALPPDQRADARVPTGWEMTVHSRP